MATVKIPPHNEDAERSVLGAILIDKEAITVVTEILSPNDFYDDTHGIIYDAMLQLSDERKPIDLLTLTSQLKKNKMNSKIGGAYVTELVNTVPTAAHVQEYAHIIKDAAIRRSLIHIGTELAEDGFQD